uniref:Uncharacterized protein n=1 Tax=Ditylenchus dipsaci TaxID=166011 RepID=A0A915DJX5_9BILA
MADESYPFGDRRMPHHLFHPRLDLDDSGITKKRLSKVKDDCDVVASDILTMRELIEFEQKREESTVPWCGGGMYYDVEFEEDKWVRIHMERGDLIVIPKTLLSALPPLPVSELEYGDPRIYALKRIGNKRMAINHCQMPHSVKLHRISVNQKRCSQVVLLCLLRVSLNERKELVFKSQKLPTMKADEVTSKWIDSVPNHPHFYEGRKVSESPSTTFGQVQWAKSKSDGKDSEQMSVKCRNACFRPAAMHSLE